MKNSIVATACAVALTLAASPSFATNYFKLSRDELTALAQQGDYQAQRNLAYAMASHPGDDPVGGCAWYKVVLMSGSPRVTGGDFGNEWTYCKRLSPEDSEAAWKRALVLIKSMSAHP